MQGSFLNIRQVLTKRSVLARQNLEDEKLICVLIYAELQYQIIAIVIELTGLWRRNNCCATWPYRSKDEPGTLGSDCAAKFH